MKNNPDNIENLKERIVHGSRDFPLQRYPDQVYNPEPELNCGMNYIKKSMILYNHWHEEAEILWVTEGAMELVVDGISIFAFKNTVVLIPPNLLHSAYRHEGQKCTFSSFVFHPDFIASKNEDIIQKEQLEPFLENTFTVSYVMHGTDRKCTTVQELIGTLKQHCLGERPYRELFIKGCLYQLLFYLLQKEEKHRIKSSADYICDERKKKILSFIESSYQHPLTLQELADSVSLSKEQFCRFFKHSFRSTPLQYLNRYRLDRSLELLRDPSLSVTEIALACGFDSSSYFAVSFRKATGMTPTQFRNMT